MVVSRVGADSPILERAGRRPAAVEPRQPRIHAAGALIFEGPSMTTQPPLHTECEL
jgi:hypothetical protein